MVVVDTLPAGLLRVGAEKWGRTVLGQSTGRSDVLKLVLEESVDWPEMLFLVLGLTPSCFGEAMLLV